MGICPFDFRDDPQGRRLFITMVAILYFGPVIAVIACLVWALI